ncbi:MAG: hypothetical protein WBP45_07905 [Daejeonella sp.]
MGNSITLFIPVILKEKIDSLSLNKLQREIAYGIIEKFFYKAYEKKYRFDFHPFASKYWNIIFGSSYQYVLKTMKQAGIIEVKGWWNGYRFIEHYIPGEVCKHMRLNRNYLSGDLVAINITSTRKSRYNKEKIKEYVTIHRRRVFKKYFYTQFQGLVKNADRLSIEMKQTIANISASSFRINNQIKRKRIMLANYGKSYISLNSAIKIASRSGKNVIQDRNHFVIENLDIYIEQRKYDVKCSYTNIIYKLLNKKYYVSRNDTNNRLDHNLTVLSKKLLRVIMEDNGLAEIDLKNSQFAILAHVMKEDKKVERTEDFIAFCEQTAKGNLYEFIKEQFELDTRSEAKETMMELAFSSHNNCTHELKPMLKKLFPTVVKYIDNYKGKAAEKYGKGEHNRFAIMLQKKEASMFIDNIFWQLKNLGFWVITKHDSLIVKSDQKEEVKHIIQQYFKSIGFEGTLS